MTLTELKAKVAELAIVTVDIVSIEIVNKPIYKNGKKTTSFEDVSYGRFMFEGKPFRVKTTQTGPALVKAFTINDILVWALA